jgi:hypothetical protein
MSKGTKYMVTLSSVVVMVLIFMIGSCISVPVMPNESAVEGTVYEYAIVSSRLVNVAPEQTLYRVTIRVESTDTIGGGADFLEGRMGKDVQFYSREKIPPEVFGKRVRAKVTFRGDERGGTFWIRDIQTAEEGTHE